MNPDPMKRHIQRVVMWLALLGASPLAFLERSIRSFCGRDVLFHAQAQLLSLVPGKWGSYLRNAYYHLVLKECPLSCRFSFGMVFTHSDVKVGQRVYIGSFSMVGMASIGDDTMIADHVHLLSGSHQHQSGSGDRPFQQQPQIFAPITIGANAWIGSNSVVMADVGRDCIIGAGSVVAKRIPDGSVAVGNPARVIKSTYTGTVAPDTGGT